MTLFHGALKITLPGDDFFDFRDQLLTVAFLPAYKAQIIDRLPQI